MKSGLIHGTYGQKVANLIQVCILSTKIVLPHIELFRAVNVVLYILGHLNSYTRDLS